MIRDNDSTRTRYGYIRNIDVPLSKNATANEQDTGGILKIAGDLAIFTVGITVGAAVLRGAGRGILSETQRIGSSILENSNSEWMKRAANVMMELKDEAAWVGRTLEETEGVARLGGASINWAETLTDAEKGLVKVGDRVVANPKATAGYIKNIAISRAAAYARRAPYELPAAYITSRFVIDREKTKQEIQQGKFKLNPVDILGDMAIKSAGLVVSDLALRTISPMGKAANEILEKTNPNYAATSAAIKLTNSAAIGLLQKYTDNTRTFTKGAVKGLSDVASEMSTGFADTRVRLGDIEGISPFSKMKSHIASQRAVVQDAGKKIYRAIGEERRVQTEFGRALEDAPRSNFGTDVKVIGAIHNAEYGFYGEAVLSRYTGSIESRLVAAGVDPKIARQLVDANRTSINKKGVIERIEQLASGKKSGTPINPFHESFGPDWSEKMRSQIKGIDPTQVDALKGQLLAASEMPGGEAASRWVRFAREYTLDTERKAIREFSRRQGRGLLDLRKIPGGRAGKNLRESMALEAFDSMGVDVWGLSSTKEGRLWDSWKRFAGEDAIEERTKTLLKSRGRAFDTPLGEYNILGLRRMTGLEMLSLDIERQRLGRGRGSKYGKFAPMFGGSYGGTTGDANNVFMGFARINEVTGSVATRRMLGEKGLYVSATGGVLDLRGVYNLPRRLIESATRNLQIPMLGTNPLDMFGAKGFLESSGHTIKYQTARGGFFERQMVPGLDIDAPLMQVGRSTFGTMKGSSGSTYIGEWNWIRNDSTSLPAALARKISGVPNQVERPAGKKRLVMGGRIFTQKVPETGQYKYLRGMPNAWREPLSGFIQSFDFEQYADKSVPHNMLRRLNRTGSLLHRAKDAVAGKGGLAERLLSRVPEKSGALAQRLERNNPRFIVNWFNDMVSRAQAGTPSGSKAALDKRGEDTLRGLVDGHRSAQSTLALSGMASDAGVMDSVKFTGDGSVKSIMTAVQDLERRVSLPENQGMRSKGELENILRELKGIIGVDSYQTLDAARLDSALDFNTSGTLVRHQIAQRVTEANILIAQAKDPETLNRLRTELADMRLKGMDESLYNELRSSLTAVEMRHVKSVEGSIFRNEQLVGNIRESLLHTAGPYDSKSYRDVYRSAGGGRRGIASLVNHTLRNEGWRSASKAVISDQPAAINPFRGSMWIGLPSFSSKVGLTGGAREISGLLRGDLNPDLNEIGSESFRTLGGIFFGQTKYTDMSMGTLAGQHLVGRISESIDTVGLGIQQWKYRNPAELVWKGLIGKRVLPAVATIAAVDALAGTPGIGKMGLMGGVATAAGPGLGMARAGIFTGTSALAGGIAKTLPFTDRAMSFVPGNDFFRRFAEVTDQDEDSKSVKWARTPTEEAQYWAQGEVPVRMGRWWVLGNNRFKGGRVGYYKPNWWRQYMSDYKYNDTSDKGEISGKSLYGSRLERMAFGYDFSPLRVIDPYHYERKHYSDRPYPVSGDYFTGPWGVMTPIANATIGRLLKPRKLMHNDDMGLGGQVDMQDASTMVTAGKDALTVLTAYESGRMNIGIVQKLGVFAKLGNDTSKAVQASLSVNNQHAAASGRGRGVKTKNLIRASQHLADRNLEMIGSGTSQAIVSGLNKTQRQSGSIIGRLGGGPEYSTGQGYIPAPFMNVIGKQPFPKTSQDVPTLTQAGNPGTLAYQAGNLGYYAQEWAGFYGFMFGAGRAGIGGGERDFAPSGPMMQASDRMYGSERAFWDMQLGGMGDVPLGFTNVQLSEITRRFVPHKRNQITEVNDIPNRMPAWMPGSESIINFRSGDPYVKLKQGELRLPGAGYEAVNRLHPDNFGAYGAFDRFKILADISPWSTQYNQYRTLLEKSDLTDEMRHQVALIKKQVAEKRRKIPLKEYMWRGEIDSLTKGGLKLNKDDPNLMELGGQESPVRLAGVRFSKSPEGKAQARAFFNTYLRDKNANIMVDKMQSPTVNNREKTIDAIVMAGGKNINDIALEKIKSGELMGSVAESKSYIDNMVKYAPEWRAIGRTWEKIAHTEVPILAMKFGRQSAAEYYERRMVYGKQWQPWETPVKSFLEPLWQTYTRDRGIATPIVAGLSVGILAGAFFKDSSKWKGPARNIGMIAGAVAGLANMSYTLRHGQRSVPTRRRREWAVDEYIDVLNYVKQGRLYEQARRAAIETEGVDPEAIVAYLGESAVNRKMEFQKSWDESPIGKKPEKPAAQKVFTAIGPATTAALNARKRMGSTMFGSDMSDDYMAKTAGIPKRYQPLVEGWLQTPQRDRKKLLDILPRAVRRVLEQQWGMPVEKGIDLAEYFKRHELPGPDWEGWLPEVDIDEIKVKVLKHEGLDSAEFGYYPNEVNDAMAAPWSYPDMHAKMHLSSDEVVQRLSELGLRDVRVNRVPVANALAAGFHFNIMHDRSQGVARALNSER